MASSLKLSPVLLASHADADLARQAVPGTWSHCVMVLMIGLVTDYLQARPAIFNGLALVTLVLSALRGYLLLFRDRFAADFWRRVLLGCILVNAAVWGAFFATTVRLYGFTSYTSMFILLFAVTVSVSGMTLLSPRLPLLLVYQALVIGPAMITSAVAGGQANWSMAFICALFLGLIAVQSRSLNDTYWRGVHDNEILKMRAGEFDAARRAAEAANRSKSEFLATISHELRTPLNGVIGMTNLVLETQVTDEQRECLETVRLSGEMLMSLINDLLDFARIEAGRLELESIEFELRDLMATTIRPFRFQAQQKDVDLELNVDTDVPDRLVGDPCRLRQVIMNLLSNALKFTPSGSVRVRVCPESQTDAGILLHFSVTDTGIGIAPEKQGLIFRAFEQADGSTSRKYGGAGLGLAICARLVEMFHGRIWVDSQPGRGSVFHFTAFFAPAAESRQNGNGRADGGHSLRVLLAEDNRVNRKLMVSMLEKWGHSVVSVEHGRAALDALDTQDFDLVLMDVQMPEMDGLEAAAAIRRAEDRSGRHTRIVALTANDAPEDRRRCIQAGMDAVVSKPVRQFDLINLMRDK